jgi:hypothetical protein
MTDNNLILRHIAFVGPKKETAYLPFKSGLNVIHGASETGKSFLIEAIDFMLGSSKPLRDIPERLGYETIFLGVEETDGVQFTLERATAGGSFRLYEGLHTAKPPAGESRKLGPKHNPTNHENVSMFLLEKIGLAAKRIRKNVRGETNSLSFRNLAHLCLISEGEIQKEGSPIETGQFMSRTAELSTFKLLLTGIDDSSVEPEEATRTKRLSRTAKIEVIDDIITDNKDRLIGLIGEDDDEADLVDQVERLNRTLNREKNALDQSEEEYRAAASRRNEARRALEEARERGVEISELLQRFQLLDEHYQSDLVRLEGIRESGALVSALDAQACPLCGSEPHEQHLDGDCDGNIEAVIQAANSEVEKINILTKELADTVAQLNAEALEYQMLAPKLGKQLELAAGELQEISPELRSQRVAFTDLLSRRTSVEVALRILSTISELEERRAELEAAPETIPTQNEPASDLSLSSLNSFSKIYEEVLKSWNFPDADRVYFDRPSRDFVISGKPRGARGKGMRALSYAAFTVSLLEFTKRNGLSHPGFALLDTPLLAYREPDGEDDDLTGTDVHQKFYERLQAISDRQLIILENVDPPSQIQKEGQCTFFSKNPHSGRYGFFPVPE